MGESYQENKYINRCLMYLNQEFTIDQRTDFEIDLLIDDQLREVYERYRLLWKVYPSNKQLLEVSTYRTTYVNHHTNRVSTYVLAIACSLLLLISSGFVLRGLFSSTEDLLSYEYMSTKGHRSTVFLNDGSKVILNGDSKISYRLENSVRKVHLEGEAFFEVRHLANQKFIVEHKGLEVEVLGTKFSVNTRNIIKEVSLLSGSVLARFNNGEQLYLKPNEKLLYNTSTSEVVREKRDVAQDLQWRDNILVFKDEKLKDALLKIEQYYGCRFKVKNTALLDSRITGTFENQSINEFVQTLSFITNCKIKLEESTYIIY